VNNDTLTEQRGDLNLKLARTAPETKAMKEVVPVLNQGTNQVTSHTHTLREWLGALNLQFKRTAAETEATIEDIEDLDHRINQ
jgi:hypothetical protein